MKNFVALDLHFTDTDIAVMLFILYSAKYEYEDAKTYDPSLYLYLQPSHDPFFQKVERYLESLPPYLQDMRRTILEDLESLRRGGYGNSKT